METEINFKKKWELLFEHANARTATELANFLEITPQAISAAKKKESIPKKWLKVLKEKKGVSLEPSQCGLPIKPEITPSTQNHSLSKVKLNQSANTQTSPQINSKQLSDIIYKAIEIFELNTQDNPLLTASINLIHENIVNKKKLEKIEQEHTTIHEDLENIKSSFNDISSIVTSQSDTIKYLEEKVIMLQDHINILEILIGKLNKK